MRRISIAILFILILLGYAVLNRDYLSDQQLIENRWGVEFYSDMKLDYKANSGSSFHGDGIYYRIFKLENGATTFKDFSNGRNAGFENAVESLLTKIDISNNKKPNWSNLYYYRFVGRDYQGQIGFVLGDYHQELYMIFFPNSQQLILCEYLT